MLFFRYVGYLVGLFDVLCYEHIGGIRVRYAGMSSHYGDTFADNFSYALVIIDRHISRYWGPVPLARLALFWAQLLLSTPSPANTGPRRGPRHHGHYGHCGYHGHHGHDCHCGHST